MKRIILVSVILLTLISSGFSQLNISTRYNMSFYKLDNLNNLINDYNKTPTLTKELPNMHLVHGVEMGIWYRFDFIAVYGGFIKQFYKSKSYGLINDTKYTKSFIFDDFALTTGIEGYIDNFVLGSNIDLNYMKFSTDKGSKDSKIQIYKTEAISSRFFIGYDLPPGGFTRLSVRLFTQVFWNKINMSQVEKNFIGTNSNNYDSNFTNFGISLIFFNGDQDF